MRAGRAGVVRQVAAGVLMIAAAVGCAARRGGPVADVGHTAADDVDEDEDEDEDADPTCVAGCLASFDGAPALAGYCDELCAPIDAPSAACIDHCLRTYEPAGYYDDAGDYGVDDDQRDDDQRAADAASCDAACAGVPVIGDDAIEACVAWCEARGDGHVACQTRCDPDPYDACVYAPCD
jgi:hypothetical protein